VSRVLRLGAGVPHAPRVEPWAPGWCTSCGLPARDVVHVVLPVRRPAEADDAPVQIEPSP